MATFSSSTPTIGVNLNGTTTAPLVALGTRVSGTNDSQWIYVLANGAISAGDCVQIASTGTATRATTAGPRTSVDELGFAQTVFADAEYGWVAQHGSGMTIATTGTLAQGAIYIGVTSGKLSNVSGSATIAGVVVTNISSTATTTTTTGVLTWPRSVLSNG